AALLPEVATQLGLPLQPPAQIRADGQATFPSTPRDPAARRNTLATDDLWASALIGALHYPKYGSERGRQRVHERLLAALDRMSGHLHDRRLLRARAFAALARREAALEELGDGRTDPEALALRAFVNGDVPALEAAAAKIKRPVPRLLAELDLFEARWTYGLIARDQLPAVGQRVVALAPESWQPLVAWYLVAFDGWSLREPLEAALLLEHLYPLQGENLESLVRGKLALGGGSDGTTELGAIAALHAGRVVAAQAGDFCCTSSAGLAPGLDLVLRLEDEALSRIVKQVDFLAEIQGRNADAVRLAEEYERTAIRGYPELVLSHVSALRRLEPALVRGGNESPARMQLLARLAGVHQALPWQGQLSNQAHALLWDFNGERIASTPWAHDFPGRWYWATRNPEGYMYGVSLAQRGPDGQTPVGIWRGAIVLREACAAATLWVDPCAALHARYLRDQRVDDAKSTAHEIEARFVGAFARTELLAEIALRAEDDKGELEVFRRDIARFPGRWDGYGALVARQIGRGAYSEAASVALSYPGFRDRSASFTVPLSGHAYDVAYGLVLRGAIEEAKPVLKIAAGYRDGSGANLWARYQLAAIEGREADALEAMGADARRYKQVGGLRKYASMLFMLGDPKTGWAVFEEGRRITPEFNVWRAAAVGLRAQNADAEATLKWVTELEEKRDGPVRMPSHGHQFNAAFQVLAVDRVGNSLERLVELETAARVPGGSDAQRQQFAANVRANPLARSTLGMVTAGYAAFKRKEYAQTYEQLLQLIQLPAIKGEPIFAMTSEAGRAGLAYLAFAAAKTGNEKIVREAFAKFQSMPREDERSFDRALIRGIFAALANRHDEADRWLKLARANMAEPGERLLPPEYAYAEILEALAADTGRREYLAAGLDWARRSQRYEPFAAWAYAFEARHAGNESDRTRALAIALYLDPQSARLAEIDAASKERARAWFKAKDPLGLTRPPRSGKPQQAT
ncbi:MAG TPA: hypothetical protein VFN70_13285, partial [Burkholderiales bacterium]|nr:hypothetical protein [Burkholderiales bacterium]